jgi:2'-5' RNA ligase
MRLFIALELPQAVKTVLIQHQDRLQTALGRDARSVRWVEAHTMHLTLHFLGEQSPAIVTDLLALVARHQDHQDAILSLGALGAFPNLKRPTTLWRAGRSRAPKRQPSRARRRAPTAGNRARTPQLQTPSYPWSGAQRGQASAAFGHQRCIPHKSQP